MHTLLQQQQQLLPLLYLSQCFPSSCCTSAATAALPAALMELCYKFKTPHLSGSWSRNCSEVMPGMKRASCNRQKQQHKHKQYKIIK
jgi:hypothetical protein